MRYKSENPGEAISALIDRDGVFRRFAGLHPYSDHPLDSVFFFGREQEAELLVNHIRAERCLVLFGRSGLGKSSLLSSAVYPGLRRQGFFPFTIRLDDPVKDIESAVIGGLEDACAAHPEIEFSPGDKDAGLWFYLFTTDIWRGDEIMTPVLVFDQFEEIFTKHDTAFLEEFAQQIGELLEQKATRVIQRLRDASKIKDEILSPSLELRVVLSMREEYFAELEAIVDWVPDLLDQRFRLLPMGEENARQAISRPASMTFESICKRLEQKNFHPGGEFCETISKAMEKTTRFRITDGSDDEDNALSLLLEILLDRRQQIDLTMLQTVCRDIEARVAANGDGHKAFVVDRQFLGSKEELIAVWRQSYDNALEAVLDKHSMVNLNDRANAHIENRLSGWHWLVRKIKRWIPGNQRTAARRFCERGLLSDDGERRISVVEQNATRRYGVSRDTLNLLEKYRLIRKDKRPGLVDDYYELAHDRLADVVFAARLADDQQRSIGYLSIVVLSLVAVLWAMNKWHQASSAYSVASNKVQLANDLLQKNFGAQLFSDDLPSRTSGGELSSNVSSSEFTAEDLRNYRILAQFSNDRTAQSADRAGAGGMVAASVGFRDPFVEGDAQGPLMLRVSGGEFEMGSQSGVRTNEQPRHTVVIDYPFDISQFEVTRADFAAYAEDVGSSLEAMKGCTVLGSNGWQYDAEASWQSPGFTQKDTHPVVCVTRDEATQYTEWLSEKTAQCYRLPSEAEWEYSARAGSTTQYWWGNEFEPGMANCLSCEGRWAGSGTAPVGKYPVNQFGLYDTAGNVFEWVVDCYQPNYTSTPADGSAERVEGCKTGVIRGGAWLLGQDSLRSAYRQRVNSAQRSALVGIRLVRTEGDCH